MKGPTGISAFSVIHRCNILEYKPPLPQLSRRWRRGLSEEVTDSLLTI